MITQKMREDAAKITFLVEQYPEKSLTELLKLIHLPSVDINAALWTAQELDWIEEPTKDGVMKIKDVPLHWEFGQVVEDLKEAILYCFEKLATKERDLEENEIAVWLQGHLGQDTLVAIKSLLVERKLVEYEVLDQQRNEKGILRFDKKGAPVMDTYIFYTLWDNSEQEWGRNNFKVKPESTGQGE